MTNVDDEVGEQLADCWMCGIHTWCTGMVIGWMHLNMVSKICGQERVWSLENCAKCTFMYKAVEKKKISAGIRHMTGRKVYGSGSTWRQVWRCSNLYGAVRGDKNANEHRGIKTWSDEKSLF